MGYTRQSLAAAGVAPLPLERSPGEVAAMVRTGLEAATARQHCVSGEAAT